MPEMSEEARLAAEWADLGEDWSEDFETPLHPRMKTLMKRPDSHLERIGAALLLVVLEHRTDKEPTLKLVADIYDALGSSATVSNGTYRSKDGEPSMEEIMASIRRIVCEEP